MNTRPHPPTDGGSGFERALRERHAEAVARISPQMRAQLAQRRHAALRGGAAIRARPGLRPLAVGLAMAGVVAMGLRWMSPTEVALPASGIAAAAPQQAPHTILDEDPEFYTWLASADGQLLALE